MNAVKFQITGTLTPVFLVDDKPVAKRAFCAALKRAEAELFEELAHEALREADDPAAIAEARGIPAGADEFGDMT
jgi:hypothetical protein